MEDFTACFSDLEDPRDDNARHNLHELLLIALCAVLCGAEDCTDLDLVRRTTCQAADQVEFMLKDDSGRVPHLCLVNFAESRLEFELVVWLTSEGIHRPLGARRLLLGDLSVVVQVRYRSPLSATRSARKDFRASPR